MTGILGRVCKQRFVDGGCHGGRLGYGGAHRGRDASEAAAGEAERTVLSQAKVCATAARRVYLKM